MSQKIIIAVGVVVLAIFALFMFNGPDNQSVSPNILYITQPVNTLSGKVEKVAGNAILISSQYSLLQTAPIVITVMPGQPPIIPTPQIKTITYKLLVTDKTQISQPALYVNYLLKTVTPAPQAKLTTQDVKVGQMITVNSAVDLRTLKSNEFEATMINLPQKMNTLSGKITRLDGNTLSLKAFQPTSMTPFAMGTAPSPAQEKEYTITITQDTEISRSSFIPIKPGEIPQPLKPEKLTTGDLKKDMQVTVYTAEDVTESQSLTALRIEPAQVMPNVALPIPEANAPISPTLSPTPSASASPLIKL